MAMGFAAGAAQAADEPPPPYPAIRHSRLREEMLSPDFWIHRLLEPNAVLLDARKAAAKRTLVYAPLGGFVDLQRVPATLGREQVAGWLAQAEQTPVKIGVDESGKPVTASS
jgi:hypothetical protein